MKLLFLGGTGIISTDCVRLAVERRHDVWLLNRGRRGEPPAGTRTLVADLADRAATAQALAGHTWDAVVDWIAFTPEDVERDLELFRGRTAQYVFISSASAYEKPPRSPRITEATPLVNPYWEYSRLKARAEARLLEAWAAERFPGTIVRPSLTYNDQLIPLAVNAWGHASWTAVARLRRGRPLIVPGDGTSLWTITHASDFAVGLLGLLGHPRALGEAFHITSDEVLTWDAIYRAVADAAGAEARLVHLPSRLIAACEPWQEGSLLGDKANSVWFDNSKLRALVPEFNPRITAAEGMRRVVAWFEAHPAAQTVDARAEATWDRMIALHEAALAEARRVFGTAS